MRTAAMVPVFTDDGVEFEVLGLPTAQGSKSAVLIGGHARLIEGKGSVGRERHKTWRTVCADAARDVAARDDITAPLDGPLRLIVEFRFAMPASRSKKVRAVGRAWKKTAPDTDKLIRALGDSMTAGGLVRDDARFALITASKVEVVGWTGATVRIEPLQ